MSDRATYTLKVNEEPDGSLYGQVHELPGCFVSGESMDELVEAAGEAIALYLASDDEDRDADVVDMATRRRQFGARSVELVAL